MNRFHPLDPHPNAQPPALVRFTELKVEPWPDGRRVRVHARLTPFQQPPNIESVIRDSNGTEVASVYIVENIDFDLVFTMHIRSSDLTGPFSLHAEISYPEPGIVHQLDVAFDIPLPDGL